MNKGWVLAWLCPPTHLVIFIESSLPRAWITAILMCTDRLEHEGLGTPLLLCMVEDKKVSGDFFSRAIFLRELSVSTQAASHGRLVKNTDSWATPKFTNLILGQCQGMRIDS